MGQVWTRAKWNDIIQRVNALIVPCDYADYLDPLPEVDAGHIWSATDISAVRNRLQWMCRNAPEDWCERVKWKQEIIDELNETIDNCDCGCTQAVVDDARSIHGLSSYVPYLLYPAQWTKTEWFGGDDHWHFYWTYRQNYDFTIAIGYGYGWAGLRNAGHLAKWHIEYWSDPDWDYHYELHSDVFDLGVVDANCDGTVTSAPSGTFVWTSPVDCPILLQPGGYPFTVWNTAIATCC